METESFKKKEGSMKFMPQKVSVGETEKPWLFSVRRSQLALPCTATNTQGQQFQQEAGDRRLDCQTRTAFARSVAVQKRVSARRRCGAGGASSTS